MFTALRTTLEITKEPRDHAYGDLFYRALPWCAGISLVVAPLPGGGDPLLPGGRAVIRDLQPHLLSETDESDWPGTKLEDGRTARVYRYRLHPEVLDVVTAATDHLYGWRLPELPEDIALHRGDGSVFLATVTREEWAALTLDDDERDALADLDLGLRSPWT